MLKITATLFAIIFLISCSKKTPDDMSIPPVVIQPDTLSTGWNKLNSNTINPITDVFFTNLYNGYYCGGDGIYRSTDAGNTWTRISTSTSSNISAVGTAKACFVGENDKIYITTNGVTIQEATYTTLSPRPTFWDIFFSSNNICYAKSNKYIWKSTDGGNSFDTLYNFQTSPTSINSIFFVNDMLGWVNRSGNVFKTIDGGITWVNQFNGSSTQGGIKFLNSSIGFLVANYSVYKTSDGGANFQPIFLNLPSDIIDLDFVDENIGYVSAGNKIYKTTDGGVNWTQVVAAGSPQFFYEIHFVDATHGWACGSNGLLLKLN